MQFNRERLFTEIRNVIGRMNQSQVDGLNEIFDGVEKDKSWGSIQELAYALATIYHETAHTFKPISEYGKGKGRLYGQPDKQTKQRYYGRGYVQLTWRFNYELFTRLLKIDLLNNPDLAMKPDVAYTIMTIGMHDGLFTGKGFKNYTKNGKLDYIQARRIINGMDKARRIAEYAIMFEKVLISAEE